jgi:hypothetical protein
MIDNAFTPTQGVPARLIAGDLWTWRADGLVAAYPDPVYSLSYSLAPRSGGAPVMVPATADAGGWLISVVPATTSAVSAGTYSWSLFATRLSDAARLAICTGTVEVAPDPTATATASNARKQLAAIDAVLEGRITKDVESYSIEGRALTRIPFMELRIMRARLVAEVAAEDRAAAGKGTGPRYRKLRF